MISDMGRIQSLVQVAERGTITAAAEAVGYTPSAVSQQLAALEAELGVPVLERRGRNVVLTDAGRLLLDHGRDALQALERAEAAVSELHGEPIGTVRIGALPSATATFLPPALCALQEQHPRLDVEVVVHPQDRNAQELRLGALDLAVDQHYSYAPHVLFDGLDETVLLREPLVLLSPASDPRSSVAAAADCDWVAAPADTACGRSSRVVLARHGIAPRIRYELEDMVATVGLVAAGLAVALVPRLTLVHASGDVHVAVVPDVDRTISALTRPAGSSRPAIRTVIEHLAAAAADLADGPVQSLTLSMT